MFFKPNEKKIDMWLQQEKYKKIVAALNDASVAAYAFDILEKSENKALDSIAAGVFSKKDNVQKYAKKLISQFAPVYYEAVIFHLTGYIKYKGNFFVNDWSFYNLDEDKELDSKVNKVCELVSGANKNVSKKIVAEFKNVFWPDKNSKISSEEFAMIVSLLDDNSVDSDLHFIITDSFTDFFLAFCCPFVKILMKLNTDKEIIEELFKYIDYLYACAIIWLGTISSGISKEELFGTEVDEYKFNEFADAVNGLHLVIDNREKLIENTIKEKYPDFNYTKWDKTHFEHRADSQTAGNTVTTTYSWKPNKEGSVILYKNYIQGIDIPDLF